MSRRGNGFLVKQQLAAIAVERDVLRARVDRLETGILSFIRYLEAHNEANKHNGEIAALRGVVEDGACEIWITPTNNPQ